MNFLKHLREKNIWLLLVHQIIGFFLNKYDENWAEIVKKIKKQSYAPEVEFNKDILTTFNFDTKDDVLMDEMLKFNSLTIFIARVLKIDGKFYHKVFLNECYYTVKEKMSL